MLGTKENPFCSETFETSIPMRGRILGFKTEEEYGGPRRSNTTPYFKELLRTTNVLLRYCSVHHQ